MFNVNFQICWNIKLGYDGSTLNRVGIFVTFHTEAREKRQIGKNLN